MSLVHEVIMTSPITPILGSSTHFHQPNATSNLSEAPEHHHSGTKSTEDTKDRPFNGFRMAASERAKHLVSIVIEEVEAYEHAWMPRKRARKSTDRKTFHRQVEAIICDLAHLTLTQPTGRIAVSRSRQMLTCADRYKPKVMSKTLPAVLDLLAAPQIALVATQLGLHSLRNPSLNKQTTIWADARLVTLIAKHRIELADLTVDRHEEVIVLKADKECYFKQGKRIEYSDTPQTMEDRKRVWRLNDFLAAADIQFVNHNGVDTVVDVDDRRMRRIYNHSVFDAGGRLYGGWWQPLKKSQRRNGILIDGMPVITLDYGQSAPRIAYGLAGIDPAFTDAYVIPGLTDRCQGTDPRAGVKKVFNALLHTKKPLESLPKGTRPLLGKGITVDEVVTLIKKAHEPITNAFCAGKGMHICYLESEILFAVLEELMAKGITALPIHDAVVVRQDHEAMVRETMLRVFKEKTCVDGMVSREA
jgi:hypothetical protein